MVLALDPDPPAAYFSAHVTDFASVRDLLAWRRSARRALPAADGVAFAKALRQIAGRTTQGFGPGPPHPRRLLLLAAWSSPEAFDAFRAGPLGRALTDDSAFGWHVLARTTRTRGSYYGHRPLAAPDGDGHGAGPVAVITLGRTTRRTLGRFLWHGGRLASDVLRAPGLISAVSAGLPLTGNATFSIWDSTDAMLAFSYGETARGHLRTARARPAILTEQLNARFQLLRIEGRWDPDNTLNPEKLAQLARALGD